MDRYVVGFGDVDRTQVSVVGGKGAQLAELARMPGVRVPAGCCVTTDAFRRVLREGSIADRLDRLARLAPDDRDAIRAVSAEVRQALEGLAIPDDVATAITGHLHRLGVEAAYAVRSSATAEDLPTASFAGQQETFLNVVGTTAILRHVGRCWASLFTERVVAYRLQTGIDHRTVQMAVVLQQMVFPEVAGVLFTADPVTGHRRVASVDAVLGLGEPLVSGRANADTFTVLDTTIVDRTVASKPRAVTASPGGGTQEQAIEPTRRDQPALTEEQVVGLVQLGRRIEDRFGLPQDIEWCLVGDEFHIVQSRPITTLFPVPTSADDGPRVFVSVGHQQMMTDAMKPLGLSLWKLTSRAPMHEAGGRLFVDVTRGLTSPASRDALVRRLGRSDPLIGDALQTIVERGDVVPTLVAGGLPEAPTGRAPETLDADPAVVPDLIARWRSSNAAAERDIEGQSGAALFDVIRQDLQQLQQLLFDPRSHRVVMAAVEATWWLDEHLQEWLGERNVADTLTQSVPHNVTSEMGLAFLDVADVIRPHPEVVAFLEHVEVGGDDTFLQDLGQLAGGCEAQTAIRGFLDTYGMRCVGEIDITRPRWRERPTALVPTLLTNIRNADAGEGNRRFEEGRLDAWAKEQELLARLRALPDGRRKADETKQMIDRVRTFAGYREYPKYGMVCRYMLYKRALRREAERLVQASVLADTDDIFHLTFEELEDVVRTHRVDDQLIAERKEAFRSYGALTPPRVITSDGEVLTGSYRRDDAPTGALLGLAVSAGTVEGRARVVLDMAHADLEPGDILVTTFTDPSWTPTFVTIAGLVTEVGGRMTHGAVVAREYGLPAVVGVERATERIPDGHRVRLDGTDGHVELLS